MTKFFQIFTTSLDMFGEPPTFYIEGNKSNKTIIGGVLTMIVYIFSIICCYLFGRELWLKKNPNTNMKNIFDPSPFGVTYFKDFEFFIGIEETFSGQFNTFIDERIYSLSLTLNTFKNGSWEYRDINLENCKNNSFTPEKYVLFKDYVYENNWCVSKNQTIPLEELKVNGLFGKENSNFMFFNFIKCSNSTSNNKCAPKEEIEKYLNSTYISIYYIDNFIDTKNFQQPLYNTITDKFFSSSINSQTQVNLLLQNIEFESDIGFMIEDMDTINGFQTQDFTIEKEFTSRGDIFTSVAIQFVANKWQYNRKYYKIQDLSAQVGGLVKFFSIIVSLCLNIFNKNSFNQLIFRKVIYGDDDCENISDSNYKNSNSSFVKLNTVHIHKLKSN
jgi:hypothetical protein